MSILQIPTSNYWPDRLGHQPRWIILHGTAGGSSAQGIAQQFIDSQGTANPKSTHYVIGQDGTVVQCVQEHDAAWGNGVPEPGCDPWWSASLNPNLVTVSVEHVKNADDNSNALTDAQQAASFALVADICDRWNIPKREADANGGVTGHYSISPQSRSRCPGAYPWQELWNHLQVEENTLAITINSPYVANYFKEISAQHWQCTNGFSVQYGVLDYYKANNGLASLGLPLENEQTIDGNGNTQQRYERGCLRYDPSHIYDNPPQAGIVYPAHVYRIVGQQIETALQPLGGKA